MGQAEPGIVVGGPALRFDEEGPTGPESAKCIVESGDAGDQLGGAGAREVRAAEGEGPLKKAALLQDDAFVDDGGPWQEIGEPVCGLAVLAKREHGGVTVEGWRFD